MGIDAVHNLLCLVRQSIVGLNLRINTCLVRSGYNNVNSFFLQLCIQRFNYSRLGFALVKMTALLLVAVRAPVICIRLVHRRSTLECNDSLVIPVLNHICNISCERIYGICPQVICICVYIAGTASAYCHEIGRGV